jgi:PAS domain-containing protein
MALALVAMVGIWALAYVIFAIARHELVSHQWGILETFADDRLRAMSAWTTDRREESLRFVQNERYGALLARFFATEETGEAWAYFESDVGVLLRRPHYEGIALFDETGSRRRVYGDATAFAMLAPPAGPSREIKITDLYLQRASRLEARVVMLAPVWSRGRYVGAMAFIINPYKEAGRFLEVSPSAAETAFLFRPLDGTIILLQTSKAGDGDVRTLPSDPKFLVTQAIAATSGRVSGLDSQDEQSIGIVRPVPNTPWFLMVQLHWDEAYAPVRHFAGYTILLTLAFLTLVGGLTYSRWRRSEAQHRADLLQSELGREKAARRFDYLAKYANDAILLLDRGGRVIEVNERATEMYRRTREDLLRLTLGDLRAPAAREQLDADWAALL